MKDFWIRVICVAAVIELLTNYNSVLAARTKDEEIARLEYEMTQAKSEDSSAADESRYRDGTYQGEADGFGGTITVEVSIEQGKITAIEIISAEINITSAEKEDGAYLSMAKDIIPKILSAQSADVDTISGATFSSTGIKNASQEALDKAAK